MPLFMSGYVRVGPHRFEAYKLGAELCETGKRARRPDAHYIRSGPDGFRYRGYVKEGGPAQAAAVDLSAPSRIAEWFDTEMIPVASGDVIRMRNEHFEMILDGINAKVRTSPWATFLPIAAVIVIFGLTLKFELHIRFSSPTGSPVPVQNLGHLNGSAQGCLGAFAHLNAQGVYGHMRPKSGRATLSGNT